MWQLKRKRFINKSTLLVKEAAVLCFYIHTKFSMLEFKYFYIFGLGIWDVSSLPLCHAIVLNVGLTWHIPSTELKNLSNGKVFKGHLSQPPFSTGVSLTAPPKDVQMDLTWIIAMPGNSVYCLSCGAYGLYQMVKD